MPSYRVTCYATGPPGRFGAVVWSRTVRAARDGLAALQRALGRGTHPMDAALILAALGASGALTKNGHLIFSRQDQEGRHLVRFSHPTREFLGVEMTLLGPYIGGPKPILKKPGISSLTTEP